MDSLATMVMSNLLTAGLAVVGTLYVNRSQRTSSERDSFLLLQADSVRRAEQMAKFEQQLDKLVVDVNRIGGAMRQIRMVLQIAGETGEVPRFQPGSSGEGSRI